MATRKTVKLEEAVADAPQVTYPELPLSCVCPEGWVNVGVNGGSGCWYQDALALEQMTGWKVVPIEMSETGIIKPNEEEA